MDQDTFVALVRDEMSCAICLGVLTNPKQLDECPHVFCGGCIAQWYKDQASTPTCPECRTRITRRWRPAVRLDRIMNKLHPLLPEGDVSEASLDESFTVVQQERHNRIYADLQLLAARPEMPRSLAERAAAVRLTMAAVGIDPAVYSRSRIPTVNQDVPVIARASSTRQSMMAHGPSSRQSRSAAERREFFENLARPRVTTPTATQRLSSARPVRPAWIN